MAGPDGRLDREVLAMLVPAGRLADDVGRKRAFLLGMALFGAASLGCAASPALVMPVAARLVQGIAAAVLIPTFTRSRAPVFPRREHPRVMGVWTAVAAAGLGILTVIHLRRAPDPVISLALFRNRLFAVAVSGVFWYYLAFAAMILAATLFLTSQWHYCPVPSSLATAALMMSRQIASARPQGPILRRPVRRHIP